MVTYKISPAGSYLACARCRAAGFCAHSGDGSDAFRIRARRLRSGESLPVPDAPEQSFFVLCEGTAKSGRRNADGSLQITGFHLPGELISFDSMFNPATRQDAVVMEPSTLREVVCQRDPATDAAVWSAMLGLLRSEAAHRRSRLRPFTGRQTAGKRLSVWIGNLVERCQQRGLDPKAMVFRMTRAEIGSYLGLAKETVCRQFVQFQRKGWIEQRGRRFLIRRPDEFLH